MGKARSIGNITGLVAFTDCPGKSVAHTGSTISDGGRITLFLDRLIRIGLLAYLGTGLSLKVFAAVTRSIGNITGFVTFTDRPGIVIVQALHTVLNILHRNGWSCSRCVRYQTDNRDGGKKK